MTYPSRPHPPGKHPWEFSTKTESDADKHSTSTHCWCGLPALTESQKNDGGYLGEPLPPNDIGDLGWSGHRHMDSDANIKAQLDFVRELFHEKIA